MTAWPTVDETATRPPAPVGGASGRITGLEGLRGLAAVGVLVTHVGFVSGAVGGRVLPGLLSRLDFGVCLFFVLSGFLLYRPWLRGRPDGSPPDLRAYAVHRAARLVPAWLLVMVGTWLVVPQTREAAARTWVAYLTLTQIYRRGEPIGPLNQLWSLSTEIAFYVALPLLAAAIAVVSRRHRRPRAQLVALGVLAVLAWGFRVAVTQGLVADRIALQWLPAHLDWFAAGMALAVVSSRPGDAWTTAIARLLRVAATPLRVAAVGLFWLCTTAVAGPLDLAPPTTSQDLVRHVAYALMAVAVVGPICVDPGDPVARVLSGSTLRRLGTISYGIFLWHLPLLYAVRSAVGLRIFGGGFWISLGLTTAASVAVASISWAILERPVLQLAHQYRPVRAPRRAVAPADTTPQRP